MAKRKSRQAIHQDLESCFPRAYPRLPDVYRVRTYRALRADVDRVSKTQRNLVPRIKHIPRDTILSRWTALEEQTQAKVQDILHSVEMPVLARHISEQKKIKAQGVAGSLTRTLGKRLPKMVFPPKTKEEHFDYEALVKCNRNIELRLAASLRSNASLKVEIEKQKGALESEQQELEELKASP